MTANPAAAPARTMVGWRGGCRDLKRKRVNMKLRSLRHKSSKKSSTEATIRGRIISFKSTTTGDRVIAQASLQTARKQLILCIWPREVSFLADQEYNFRGALRHKGERNYILDPSIEIVAPKRTFIKLRSLAIVVIMMIITLSPLAYGLSTNKFSISSPIAPIETVQQVTKSEVKKEEPKLDVDKLLEDYDSTYDSDTNSLTFKYDDLKSYFSSYNSGNSNWSAGTYRNGSETWTINCSKLTNSCNASSSSGGSASTYCSRYINSCNTYGSDGSSATTHCSQYTSSCNTYGSDGYSSNTHCSKYINSCNSYDSNGNTSSTYCSSYINSCNTYGSDGTYSNTYCSSYGTSCNTQTYGGYDY